MNQKTLVIIKPDAYKKKVIGEIISIFERNKLDIVQMKLVRMTKKMARVFYQEHEGKDFFEKLISFMASGNSIVMVLESENAIEVAREIIGSTEPSKARPGTLRYIYGESLPLNAVHASDSETSAKREINFFFPELKEI